MFDNLRIDPGVTFHRVSPNRTLPLSGEMVSIPLVGEERALWQYSRGARICRACHPRRRSDNHRHSHLEGKNEKSEWIFLTHNTSIVTWIYSICHMKAMWSSHHHHHHHNRRKTLEMGDKRSMSFRSPKSDSQFFYSQNISNYGNRSTTCTIDNDPNDIADGSTNPMAARIISNDARIWHCKEAQTIGT